MNVTPTTEIPTDTVAPYNCEAISMPGSVPRVFTGQLDEPELPVTFQEPRALAEEAGDKIELGEILLARPPIVHDRRRSVVEQHVVPDEQMRDAGGPRAGEDIRGLMRIADVPCQGVVLEDEIGPVDVIAVAPHVDQPHAVRRR